MAPPRTWTAQIVTNPSTIIRMLEYSESRLRGTDELANSWCWDSPVLAGVKTLGPRRWGDAYALAALTDRIGGRPSAIRSHFFPALLLKKSWPVPVPT